MAEPHIPERLLREVHRVARIGTWELANSGELIWSKETLEIFGLDAHSFSGSVEQFYQAVHEEDRGNVRSIESFAESHEDYFRSAYRIVRPDGDMRHIRQTALVSRDENGDPLGFCGMVQDVTEQVVTESKLRHAQKMEAIGHLSSGVAHDFNNILAAVLGAAELLEQSSHHDKELLESIVLSASRGGDLTRRLLAFARNEPLKIVQINLPETLFRLAPMLQRMVGNDIHLNLDLDHEVWTIDGDPAPLEEAIVNLVINSRDAIVGAGSITLCCRNVVHFRPGELNQEAVEISVSDNGAGMTPDVLSQACDPFFTTKPIGKGTGLGLSIVDGFVRQSGGAMGIVSSPEEGTSVSITLPKGSIVATAEISSDRNSLVGNGESILILEDDESLANLISKQLTMLNFAPCIAQTGDAALNAARHHNGFDIVLSDILLADGEKGPSVVQDLLRIQPQVRPIFMSGFASDSSGGSDMVLARYPFLRKPFSMMQLASAIGNALRD